jgi:hypothetical protein
MGGDGDVIADIYCERLVRRGKGRPVASTPARRAGSGSGWSAGRSQSWSGLVLCSRTSTKDLSQAPLHRRFWRNFRDSIALLPFWSDVRVEDEVIMRKALVIGLAVLGLAGCGDRDVPYEGGERSYQGKPDGKPWNNEPLAYDDPKWTRGDQASWEAQIKKRQLGQHEDTRIRN